MRLPMLLPWSRQRALASLKPRTPRLNPQHIRPWTRAWLHTPNSPITGESAESRKAQLARDYAQLFRFDPMTDKDSWTVNKTVTACGFIRKPRKMSKDLVFAEVHRDGMPTIKLCGKDKYANALRQIQPHSAVTVTGTITGGSNGSSSYEMDLTSIDYLNPFPKDIIVSADAVFPPKERYLQLRFHAKLKEALQFRASLKQYLMSSMQEQGYMEVETPVLFKSTSEGAREFIVPTRRAGFAYALPQSPQQYKQVLMAAGQGGYYQFARCFRDEDHRADRQPEFTQLDLEKSFADGYTIKRDVETMVRHAWSKMQQDYLRLTHDSSWTPVRRTEDAETTDIETRSEFRSLPETPFRQLGYQQCMEWYGSDKPDLRIPNKIYRAESQLSPGFVGMITHLQDPIVDVWKLSLDESAERRDVREFVTNFMEKLGKTYFRNPDGTPQVMIHDSSKPLNGFSTLGPEGLETLCEAAPEETGLRSLQDGDILLVQARKNRPHQGGSTKVGEIRSALYHAAVDAGLHARDPSFEFLWVTDFPMFTPNEEVDVGQGGSSGFSATHHPFTAPKSPDDFQLLFQDPLKATADHYDLVLNGVELGGGSRRIHVAHIQEFIMRDILKLSEDKIAEFSHLLRALRAGCPPHAGFALGFDRFAAVLSESSSVRDVIAFPKNNKGVDEFAGGPGKITQEQLETYHLQDRTKKS